MNRRMPGLRKSRSDAGKVKRKMGKGKKKMVKELLESGTNITDITKLTGETKEKIAKVRSQYSEASIQNEEPGGLKESSFGDKGKEIFRKLFDLDLIAPDRGIKLKVKSSKVESKSKEQEEWFIIPREDLEDVCMILANAWNRAEFAGKHKLKVDRDDLRKRMIVHLMEQQIRLASASSSTKDIEALTRMYDRMRENIELNPNVLTVEAICKELKPDISFDDIISLIKKHSV